MSEQLSTQEIQTIQTRLSELLEAGEIVLKDLENFTREGYGKTAWSQFKSGKYGGDIQKIANIGREFLRRRDALEGLAATTAYKATQQMYRICDERRELGIIIAPSGSGKTISARAYAKANRDTIFVSAPPAISQSGLLMQLQMEMGMTYGGHIPQHERLFSIIQALRNQPRFLIIDEANQLSVPSLDHLRTIHDDGNCGMVLQGDDKLETTLRSGGRKQNLAQLYSRVRRRIRIDKPTDADIREIFEYKGMHLNGDERVLQALRKYMNDAGELRKLIYLIEQIDDLARWGKIEDATPSLQHIELAHKSLIAREV